MFTVKSISKRIADKLILSDVSFAIGHGEIGIFMGDSGVGKSTLLRVLNNLEPCDSGLFSLDDKPLNLTQVNKEHMMGLVFQHFNLFENLTAQENISLPLIKLKGLGQAEARKVAEQLLKRYDLLALADNPVAKLSGGQKQRLAIARTLSVNPKIICMDEPTSALDPHLKRQVAKYIQDLAAEGRIVVLATHDTGLIHQLEEGRLFLMKEGTIIESCTLKDYRENPEKHPSLHSFLKLQGSTLTQRRSN